MHGSMYLERLSHVARAANAQVHMAVLPCEDAHEIDTERRRRCHVSGGGHTHGEGLGVRWQYNSTQSLEALVAT